MLQYTLNNAIHIFVHTFNGGHSIFKDTIQILLFIALDIFLYIRAVQYKNDVKHLISDRRSDVPTELQFKIIGSRTLHQPPPKYTKVCHLCKENIISTQKFTPGKNKPGRKELSLDKNMTELGLLVSKEGVDICVHQMCVDYVPGMVQNMETEPGILKIDGYKVDEIKKLKGSRCKYCQKNRGMTPCAFRNCKSKKHNF